MAACWGLATLVLRNVDVLFVCTEVFTHLHSLMEWLYFCSFIKETQGLLKYWEHTLSQPTAVYVMCKLKCICTGQPSVYIFIVQTYNVEYFFLI